MQLQISQRIIDNALDEIQASLSNKVVARGGSQNEQEMAVDVVGFLALQVVIPILASLCSSVIYDVLKGRALAKLHREDADEIVGSFCGKFADTREGLTRECLDMLSSELAPLGFGESEIVEMYEKIIAVLEKHSDRRQPGQEEAASRNCQNSGQDNRETFLKSNVAKPDSGPEPPIRS